MSPIHFHTAGGIHPAPLARPFSKGLLIERIHSLFLSFRLEDPSCAFDAPLLQKPAANFPQKEKSQLSLTLFRDRVSNREADIGHCFFLPPR